ncbi:MAG: iron-containing redox enzyme family protein [Gammaproteobacteria bacterium]
MAAAFDLLNSQKEAASEIMDRNTFCHQLLDVMCAKDHWAWPAFTSGMVPKHRLHIHFEQEYATYVRDFPVMVGWVYVQCPILEVRRALVENLYEEETGALVAGRPHPELFLEYPRGLGMDLSRFVNIKLMPAAKTYRALLDNTIQGHGWEIAAAVVTIFIEGTKDDRVAVDPSTPKRDPLALCDHPLVRHYGLSPEYLTLTRAHQQVEGDHRATAWKTVLDFVSHAKRKSVLTAMRQALACWLRYRNEVAAACGIERGRDGRPRVAPL